MKCNLSFAILFIFVNSHLLIISCKLCTLSCKYCYMAPVDDQIQKRRYASTWPYCALPLMNISYCNSIAKYHQLTFIFYCKPWLILLGLKLIWHRIRAVKKTELLLRICRICTPHKKWKQSVFDTIIFWCYVLGLFDWCLGTGNDRLMKTATTFTISYDSHMRPHTELKWDSML